LVVAEIDVESLEGKRLHMAQVAWFSSRRLMNGACLVGAIAPRFFESSSAWLCEGILPTNLEWLRGLNALRVLAQGNAAEQIVGPERR
jgi:hypothetical protein